MAMGIGAINGYICRECKGVIITEDCDLGATPMFLSCRATEGCEGRMTSMMYPRTPLPPAYAELPHWRWVAPRAKWNPNLEPMALKPPVEVT